MKTTAFYLDAVAARLGDVSDYRVSKVLSVSQQSVSRWRSGKDAIGDDAAIKIAAILECDPAEILISSAASRAKSASVREAWQHAFSIVTRGGLALVLAGFFLLFYPPNASANYAGGVMPTAERFVLCKVLTRRCRRHLRRLVARMPFCIARFSFRRFMPFCFFRPVFAVWL